MSTEQQAQLLEEIAAVMRERPEDGFLEFQHNLLERRTWNPYTDWIRLVKDAVGMPTRVRRRPRTITIAGIEVPEPMREAPEVGTWVCPISINAGERCTGFRWEGKRLYEETLLRQGMLHPSEQARDEHERALILASGGKVE